MCPWSTGAEDSLQGSGLFFHSVGHEEQMQVLKLGSIGPRLSFLRLSAETTVLALAPQ